MDEERLIEIETRIAFQEQTIKTLSDLIYKQRQEVDRLGSLYESMEKGSKKQEKPKQDINDLIYEKPPHY